ncbi:MAG: hypothetical protein ACKVN8_04675 [Nitrosarchaeum sp.]
MSTTLLGRIYIRYEKLYNMAKSLDKQKNKNNKTKPANLMKKEYLESLEQLKNDIKENKKV